VGARRIFKLYHIPVALCHPDYPEERKTWEVPSCGPPPRSLQSRRAKNPIHLYTVPLRDMDEAVEGDEPLSDEPEK
jgi:hypothetical protein